MSPSSAAKKRKLIKLEEIDVPSDDVNKAIDMVTQGFDLAVSSFASIQSATQDELTRIAMERKQKCIDLLNRTRRSIKEVIIRELKQIAQVMEESRRRSEEMKLYQLHEDILLTLFAYLPLKQILKLRLISVRMHQVITDLLSRRVKWVIQLGDYNLSLSHFNPSTSLHLKLTKCLSSDEIKQLQTNSHRFQFSLIDDFEGIWGTTVEKNVGKSKQTSIIINASSKTLHTLKLYNYDRIYKIYIKNDLDNLQHLSFCGMKDKSSLFILKKCAKSLKYLSLENTNCNLDKLNYNMEKLETLIVKESPKVVAKLPSLLAKCASTLKCLTLQKKSFCSLGSLDVDMTSLEKIVISNANFVIGLQNLLDHSPNLKHLEVVHCSSGSLESKLTLKQSNLNRLTLKQNTCSFDHELILACRDNLQVLDIECSSESDSSRLLSLEWYFPKLKEITWKIGKLRGSDVMEQIKSSLFNHIPSETRILTP